MGAFDEIIAKFGNALGRMGAADQTQGEAMSAFLQAASSPAASRGQRIELISPPPYDPRFTVNDPYSGVSIEEDIPRPLKSVARLFSAMGMAGDPGIGPAELAAPAAMVVSKATLPKFIEAFRANFSKMQEMWPDIDRRLQGALAFMYTKNPKLMNWGRVEPEVRVADDARGVMGYFMPSNHGIRVIENPPAKPHYAETLGHELTHRVNWHRHPEYAIEARPLETAARNAWERADEYTYRTGRPVFPGSVEDNAIRDAEDALWNSRSESYARQGGRTASTALQRFRDLVAEQYAPPSVFPPAVKEP